MKECPACSRCYPDQVNHCPADGDALRLTIAGDTVLDGRYQLERRLGQGGMGAVFKGRHVFLKTTHAIKVILPDLVGNDPSLVTRFRQEAMAAAAIQHPNIISVTDFGVVNNTMPFLVMEFLEGRSLHELLVAEKRLDPARALEIMLAVASGVGAAHRGGIVHRDLKPLNIMLRDAHSADGGVKVLDFGLAKIKSTDLLGSFVAAKTQGLMGSPFYMAPEQWGDEEPDVLADIYSMGVILYQMLAGEVPFRGNSIPAIMKKHLSEPPPPLAEKGVSVPIEVERVLRHALEKEPGRRTPSVDEFTAELRAALAAVARPEAGQGTAPDIGLRTVALDAPSTVPPAPQSEAPPRPAFDPALGLKTVAGAPSTPRADDTKITDDLTVPSGALRRAEGQGGAAAHVREEEEARRADERARGEGLKREESSRPPAATVVTPPLTPPLTSPHVTPPRVMPPDVTTPAETPPPSPQAPAASSSAAGATTPLVAPPPVASEPPRTAGTPHAAPAVPREEDARRDAPEPAVAAPPRWPEPPAPSHVPSRAPSAAAPTRTRVPLALLAAGGVLTMLCVVAGLYFFLLRPSEVATGDPAGTNAGRGANAGPSPAQQPSPSGGAAESMVALAGGTFQMGRDDVPPRTADVSVKYQLWVYSQWPAHAVRVAPFFIDRTEVTNAEYAECVRAGECPVPRDDKEASGEALPYWRPWRDGRPPAGQEQWPVRNVSYDDAVSFAVWRSRRDGVSYRLPTEAEWEYAARDGGRFRLFPWGDGWQEGHANVGAELPRPVGSYPQGATPAGAHDMIGNVWEWTSSQAAMYTGNDVLQLPPSEGGKIVVRGGSYQSRASGDEPVTATARRWVARETRDPVVGFRLARPSN